MDRKFLPAFFLLISIAFYVFPGENTGILFQYPTGGRVAAAVFDGGSGSLYILSGDRYLYSLTSSGKMKWRTMLDAPPSRSLTIGYDRTVYTGTVSDTLYAVNPGGGIIWKIAIEGSLVGNAVATQDGNIIFVTDKSFLYSVSHRGVVRYSEKLSFRPALPPLMNNDYLFLPGADERIHAFDPWGNERWTFVLAGKPLSAALSASVLWVGTEAGTVAAVDMEGRKLWSVSLGPPVHSLIAVDSDNVLAAGGAVLFSIRKSGSVRWKYGGREPFYSVVSDGNVYAASQVRGGLSFFSLSGYPLGTVDSGKPSVPVCYISEGVFFTGSRDWNLYAGRIMERNINSVSSPLWFCENGGRDGNRVIPELTKRSPYGGESDSNDFRYLVMQADSLNMSSLNTLLDGIEARLESDKPDSGKAYLTAVLEYLVSDCITRPRYKDTRLVNDFPSIRGKAVRLLGKYGDFVSQEVLLNLLFYEWDTYVLRSMITSIGMLGYNPDNTAADGLYRFYVSKRKIIRNYPLDGPLVNALKEIYRYSGSIGTAGVRLAVSILSDSGDTDVKQSVLDLLKSLKK